MIFFFFLQKYSYFYKSTAYRSFSHLCQWSKRLPQVLILEGQVFIIVSEGFQVQNVEHQVLSTASDPEISPGIRRTM